MKKKNTFLIIKLLLVIIIIIELSGCVATNKLEIKQLEKINNKIVILNLPTTNELTGKKIDFNFQKEDISNEIIKLSKYKKFHCYKKCNKSLQYYKGLKVTKEGNNYLFKYSYGSGWYSSNIWHLSEITFKLSYTMQGNKIIFTFPPSYQKKINANEFGTSTKTLDSIQNIKADIKKIFNNIQKATIFKKTYQYNLTGEINTKYNDKSIYSNFKRILGNYKWRYSSEKIGNFKKENTFSLKYKDNIYPLHVEVYPYRDGSKVKYTTRLSYIIDSERNISLSKKDLSIIEEKIKQIVND
jgi:hypothetical protein